MTKEELMIGDWVFCTQNRKPEQVQEIGTGLVMLDYNDLYEYDEVEPIVLTAEILRRNGFVEYRKKHFRWEYDDGIFINADFTAEEPFARVHNRCYFASPVCRYVHQLQHAMLLCGIRMKIKVTEE